MRAVRRIHGYRLDAHSEPERLPGATAVAAAEQATVGPGVHDLRVARIGCRREDLGRDDARVGRPPRLASVEGLRDPVRGAQVERRWRLRVDRDRPAEARAQCAPGCAAVGCPEDTLLPGGDIKRSRITGVERETGEVDAGALPADCPGQPTVSAHEHTGGAHGVDGSGAGRVDGDRPEIVRRGSARCARSRRRLRSSRSCCAPCVRPGAFHCREQDLRVRRVDRQSADRTRRCRERPPGPTTVGRLADMAAQRHPQRHRQRCCRWGRPRARRRSLHRARPQAAVASARARTKPSFARHRRS